MEYDTVTASPMTVNPRSFDDKIPLLAMEQSNETSAPSCDIDSDVLELWRSFENSLWAGNDSVCSSPKALASTSKARAMDDTPKPYELTIPNFMSEPAPKASKEPYVFDRATTPSHESGHTSRQRPPLPRANTASQYVKTLTVSSPSKSLFRNARAASVQYLQSLLDSSKVDIVNGDTGEVYVKGVSLNMLEYFCGRKTISSLIYRHLILVPPAYASEEGFIRVIRYMRRWCQNASVRPTGELRAPPSIKEGIATCLACRFLGLEIDAQHMEDLVVQDLMNNLRYFVTDEDVELIWCGYEGTLRDTSFGNAVVWFILEQVMGGTHALADEIRWILEQEEYDDLKARVRYEMRRATWRGKGRRMFLQCCLESVDYWHVASEGMGKSDADRRLGRMTSGRTSVKGEKPLPYLPAGS